MKVKETVLNHLNLFRLIFLVVSTLYFTGSGYAAGRDITIQWDESIDAPYLQSYKIYYYTVTNNPESLNTADYAVSYALVGGNPIPINPLTDPKPITINKTNTQITLHFSDDSKTYYFVLTAIDTRGLESLPTPEVASRTIDEQTFNALQGDAASSGNCTLSNSAAAFASSNVFGSVTVAPSSNDFSWTAASNDSWITVTSGSSGTGNGTVVYTVAENKGLTRTGTITISGQTFTITQASANSYLDILQKIYIGYYQRPADPAGLIYWAERFDSRSGNLNDIMETFENSTESWAIYGMISSRNIHTFINGIYRALFNRDADREGRDYYVAGFNSGAFTAGTIMLYILNGARNDDLVTLSNKLIAANKFTSAIDPELDGSNFQVTYDNSDAVAARYFLSLVTSSSETVPTQSQTAEYIRSYIADTGDGILAE